MEVSGKKHDTTENRGSSEMSENLRCQPCSADGEELEADGFCENCQEYLCGTCIRYHRKATLSKHHVILDKEKMPKNVVPKTAKQLCTETCQKHVLEVVKFFCKDHGMVGCGNCMVFDHKSCNIDFIPDVADDFVSGAEYKMIFGKLEQLLSNVQSVKKDLEQRDKKVVTAYATAIEDIRKFRKEVEQYMDQMEQSITEECNRIKKENEETVKNIKDDLQSFNTELHGLGDRLTSHSKQTGDLFVQAKRTSVRFNQLEQDMKGKVKHALKSFEFKRNKDILDIVSKKSPFGKLVTQSVRSHLLEGIKIVEFTPMPAGEINVKATSDRNTARISSMIAISQDALLCVDRNNKSVKVVDTVNRCICSQITLASGPLDITQISEDQVAVTVSDDKKIYVLDFLTIKEKELTVRRSMKVDGKCRGIAYTNDKLVVSYESTKMEILSVLGEVLQTFKNNRYSWLGCVDVGIHGDCLFVSDFRISSVYKMAMDGRLLDTYKDKDLLDPRALTVRKDGSVLVCSSRGHTVHLMSPDCRKVKILLTDDYAKYAQSVFYNESTATLYLSNFNFEDPSGHSVIRVFRNA